MINEHDMTKSMLGKMRSIKLIKEVVDTENTMGSTETTNQPTETPNTIVILKNGGEQSVENSIFTLWKTDKQTFMDRVSSDVSFTDFEITPKSGSNEGDVKMSGKLNAYDIGFTMNKNASLGLLITTAIEGAQSSKVKLDDTVIKTLNSLNNYYQIWYKDWSEKLENENFKNAQNV